MKRVEPKRCGRSWPSQWAVVTLLLLASGCGEDELAKPSLASADGSAVADAQAEPTDTVPTDSVPTDSAPTDSGPTDFGPADAGQADGEDDGGAVEDVPSADGATEPETTESDAQDPDVAPDPDGTTVADATADASSADGESTDASPGDSAGDVGSAADSEPGSDGAGADAPDQDATDSGGPVDAAATDSNGSDLPPSDCPNPAICNDKNPCTTDTCKKGGQCVWTVKAGPCEDGNPCTTGEACDFLQCVGGKVGDPKVICDDANACTNDTCDAAKGGCQHAAAAGSCNDGDPCTSGEACSEGKCKAAKAGNTCDDGKGCTIDNCEPKTGACSWVAITGNCDDGDACTVGDLCQGLNCAPGKAKSCPDGGACADAGCNAKSGECYAKAIPGAEAPACDGTATEGLCFKAYKTNGAFAAAELACAAWGGHLARIASPAQNDAARNQGNSVCSQGSNAWIGFTDAAKEGTFAWTDGGLVTYSNWAQYQPDNYQPGCAPQGSGEDATHLAADGKWNDICITAVLPCHVCSRPAPTIACAEPSQCLQGGVCVAGKCLGTKPGCDDNNSCTTDSCAPTGACLNLPSQDGTVCGSGQCFKGVCSKGGEASNPAASCADAKAALASVGAPAVSGLYWIDADGSGPASAQQASCEMASAGGGWTLVAVVSDDNKATFTWNTKSLWDTSSQSVGSLAELNKDYRSPLLAQLPIKDLMFSHVAGVWAQYSVGGGKQSLGQVVAATTGPFNGSKCYALNGNDGWPLVAGNLQSGGNLCNTSLYFNPADHDGKQDCGDNEHSWGPAWNVKGPSGCFDDPGEFGALGPVLSDPGSEGQFANIGFGWALGLNKGKAEAAQNWMRVYVR